MQMFRKRDEGFTLVELMVVVLIIGILVAIAIPVFNSARGNAEKRSCFANQRTINGAVQTYYATVEAEPATVAELVAPTVADPEGVIPGPFLKAAPECPSNNLGYTIVAGLTDCPGTALTGVDHGTY